MKRIAIILLLILIALPVIGGFVVGAIAKQAVNQVGPSILGVPVSVEGISLSLLGGSATISGLKVGNPEGYSENDMFALGIVDVDLDVLSLLSHEIVVGHIDIDAPRISYELGQSGSNIQALLQQINEGSATNAQPEAGPNASRSESSGEGKTVVIDRLVLSNAELTIVTPLASGTASLPTVTVNDIGRDTGGAGAREVAQTVIHAILSQIKSVDMGSILGSAKGLSGDLKKGVEELGNKLKGLF